ncbi:1 4-dihydroxy-2-naphthoate octaprenyltransferase [termite gut metagenome]|uniref:1 4-dihydroxy-2-naphthoate octaprenyltransferase n=1 Tax=termite gut metagenome TaxID=433724 RepID=A0A5J4RBT0_9ZZZZ
MAYSNSRKEIKPNSLQAWISSSRPKTLVAALIPVAIGSSLAYADGKFNGLPTLICTLFACLMQIAANLINDFYDYLKGVDKKNRIGPERSLAEGWITPKAMKRGIAAILLAACVTGSCLLFYGGGELILVGAFCFLFAYLYTGGPYPLSYYGAGDVLVVIFFGFVPVCGTYYVQTSTLTVDVLIASLVSGLTINTLLIINNYRDRNTDKASNKRTLIVRLGEPFGRYFYLFTGVAASLLCFWFLAGGHLYAAILPQIYLIFHFMTWRKMVRIYAGKALNVAFGETARNMLLMGLLLSAGWLLEGF